MNRTIFYFSPETCFRGTQALQKEELLFFMKIEGGMHKLLQEVNFFQLNIDADCNFTAMLPRVFV